MYIRVNGFCCCFKDPRTTFRDIVEHSFTGSYLLKQYGAHYRKAMRILSGILRTAIFKTGCRCLKWKLPPTAPPTA